MLLKKLFAGAATAALLATASVSARADFVDVDIAGWQTAGEFGVVDNTFTFLNIAAGSLVTGFSYSNLAFSTQNGSWLREFTISVNNSDATQWLDWAPSLVAAEGNFGPASGSWGGPTGGPGLAFLEGGAFTTTDGSLFFTVYESFDDPIGDNGTTPDALVSSGVVRIFYTPAAPVPEASTYAMMLLGLAGLGAVARRRKS